MRRYVRRGRIGRIGESQKLKQLETRTFMSTRLVIQSLVVVLAVGSCPSCEQITEGSSGILQVTASKTGHSIGLSSYTVTVDGQQSRSIGVNATITFSGLLEGDHTVALTGIASNCMVSGSNPRTVNVPADGTASTNFDISCTSTGDGSDAMIIGVSFEWGTHTRLAPGSDNWPMTWSDDDHQYTSWGDGGGFGGTNTDGRVSFGFARVEADHRSYQGFNRWGGNDPECPATFDGKAYGILSIEGVLYAWRSPGSNAEGFQEFALIKSTDKGCSWTDPAESPVVWDGATFNLAHGVFLNFGQDYAGARDTFVYSYAADIKDSSGPPMRIQDPGAIYLMRVPVSDIENQEAYEFFTGTPQSPSWGAFADRVPVFEDAAGVSWTTGSVTHVPGLGRYVLITEHTASRAGNIQIHEAPEPWGPWTEVLRESGWGQVEASTFYWTLGPRWFRNGGRDFTLVFSGINQNDSWNTVDGSFTVSTPVSLGPWNGTSANSVTE
ncbi:DUF4185 domain-containing protein [Nitrosococcus wardiae]|uniref:DUF4185 domain-containing protein n=1 Tax=Nitrosococcus wardiae TaxID=1814290 RepID=UPI00141A950E|nr:DUF4185 domain-containing protein [Nitrosococcus wardiae]